MMPIAKNKIEEAEEQIYQLRKLVGYDIRELTIEIIVGKYNSGLNYNEDEDSEDEDYP